jgi:hypothetical protein
MLSLPDKPGDQSLGQVAVIFESYAQQEEKQTMDHKRAHGDS